MIFGKRATAPGYAIAPAAAGPTARTRRGGYWLGLLTAPVVALIGVVVMALLPLTNPTGAPLTRVLLIVPVALINVTVVTAILMLPVDLILRTLNLRRPWIYALVCGLTVYVSVFLLMALLSLGTSLLFLLGICGLPAAAAGWVMGLFRS